MFLVPEKYRITDHSVMKSSSRDGNNGPFEIPFSLRSIAYVIASDGAGWEHVSVHIISNGIERTPTWSEMCRIKDLFWSENDCVVQYHPAKSEYVNTHKNTLHLWKPTIEVLPKPNPLMVGIVSK